MLKSVKRGGRSESSDSSLSDSSVTNSSDLFS
jgi:hypothetical protein